MLDPPPLRLPIVDCGGDTLCAPPPCEDGPSGAPPGDNAVDMRRLSSPVFANATRTGWPCTRNGRGPFAARTTSCASSSLSTSINAKRFAATMLP